MNVSSDGKTFVSQTIALNPFGNNKVGNGFAFLDSSQFNDIAFYAFTTERIACMKPTGTTTPIPTVDESEIYEQYSISPTGLIVVGHPTWTSLMVFEDEIYASSNAGQIIKSATGALGIGNWSVVTADQAGSDSSEIIASATIWYFMTQINGVFWACEAQGGAGNWYRHGTGGAPIGYGWVQDDTGPFGVTIIHGAGEAMRWMRTAGVRFAYCGREVITTSDSHVYFDIGDQ